MMENYIMEYGKAESLYRRCRIWYSQEFHKKNCDTCFYSATCDCEYANKKKFSNWRIYLQHQQEVREKVILRVMKAEEKFKNFRCPFYFVTLNLDLLFSDEKY